MDTDKTPTAQDTTLKPVDATPKVTEPSPGEGEPSPGEGEPSPKEALKTLTLDEAERLAQLARMDAGRAQKAAEVERDSIKAQLESKETELEEVVAEREKLKTEVDDLASGDPARFNIVKKDRDLIERERKLKTGIQSLETDKQANAEEVKWAKDTRREVTIWETATKYEGGDPVKLKDLCETFGANTTDQITKVAETLWPKKTSEPKEPETPPLKPFSGRTSGGGGFTPDKKTPDETLKEGFKQAKK